MQAYARAYVRAYARIHTRCTYNAHAHAHTLRGVHAITHIHVHFTQAVLAREDLLEELAVAQSRRELDEVVVLAWDHDARIPNLEIMSH